MDYVVIQFVTVPNELEGLIRFNRLKVSVDDLLPGTDGATIFKSNDEVYIIPSSNIVAISMAQEVWDSQ